ncbi:MAG TPA: hypothetical protein VG275_07205 [Solirubrobacteraceae bacterium]|jgi:hypothetical protein|nr:hypothetical protein [Solirubrobacteraceae bacterium]
MSKHRSPRRRTRSNDTGALRQAAARWREFDAHRERAEFAAARDAMAFEDDAGFTIRPHVRGALR